MTTNWYLGEIKNYDRFNFVSTNRDINNANLKKIESSILDIGVQIPIVVNQNYDIIDKKMANIRSLELLMWSKTNSGIKATLKEGKYRVNLECDENVFEAIQIMNNYEMNTSPYTNKIVRGLKYLYYEFNGLNLKAIEHMVKNNYITSYANDMEQKKYMSKIYKRSLKSVK